MYEAMIPKRSLAFRVQAFGRSGSINSKQEHPSRLQYPAQLREPNILHGLIQVCEHREAVDDIEVLSGVW